VAPSVALQLVALEHAKVVAAVVAADVHVVDIPGADVAVARPYKVLYESTSAVKESADVHLLQIYHRCKDQPVLLGME